MKRMHKNYIKNMKQNFKNNKKLINIKYFRSI